MKSFLIGQHGQFDYKKLSRDYHCDFYGIEACSLISEEAIQCLIIETNKHNANIGIHFPLRAGIAKLRDAQFMSLDYEIKRSAYEIIEEEFKYISARGIKPVYILFHYPKPVIINEKFDLCRWKFADDSEFYYENQYTFEKFKASSEELFSWLSDKGREYNFIPVMELDALNKYIYEEDFFDKLLEKYPSIRLCLDLGRLHIQDKIEASFNSREVIKRFSKYALLIHLWNVRVNEKLENYHYPVLPGLKPEEGWAPIEDYMKIIIEENKNVKFLFEHRSDLISDEELDKCYNWINALINKNS